MGQRRAPAARRLKAGSHAGGRCTASCDGEPAIKCKATCQLEDGTGEVQLFAEDEAVWGLLGTTTLRRHELEEQVLEVRLRCFLALCSLQPARG